MNLLSIHSGLVSGTCPVVVIRTKSRRAAMSGAIGQGCIFGGVQAQSSQRQLRTGPSLFFGANHLGHQTETGEQTLKRERFLLQVAVVFDLAVRGGLPKQSLETIQTVQDGVLRNRAES